MPIQRFIADLKTQVELLETYCDGFDQGNEALALPMATSIRVLVHDTRSSTSLLEMLGVKGKIRFTDTASHIMPGNLLGNFGLVVAKVTVGQGGEYVAPVDDVPQHETPPSVSFPKWWKTPITVDTQKNEFARKDMILATANKLGGAHVDPVVPADIAYFQLPESFGWQYVGPDGAKDFENSPLPPSIRQIAYELLDTIKNEVRPLFS